MTDIERCAKILTEFFDGEDNLVSQHGKEIVSQLEAAIAKMVEIHTNDEEDVTLLKDSLTRLQAFVEEEGYDKVQGEEALNKIEEQAETAAKADRAISIMVSILQHLHSHLSRIIEEMEKE